MKNAGPQDRSSLVTTALAVGLWFVTFYLDWLNFWVKISFSAAALACLAAWAGALRQNRLSFDRTALVQGVVSAVALYLVFWLGKEVSSLILPFAPEQVGAIYARGTGFSTTAIFFLLLLVTGPCEEIFWRGFLQRNLMLRYGDAAGFLVSTAIYTGVHVWSLTSCSSARLRGRGILGLMYLKLAGGLLHVCIRSERVHLRRGAPVTRGTAT
jgi:membrane protease YdiL (CAAX protease family)